MNLAGSAAAAFQLASAPEKEDVAAVAALPGKEAEAMPDEALEEAGALDAGGTLAFTTGT